MNSFWNLVGFEYKKIMNRKSVIIAMSLALLISIVSCLGILLSNHYIEGELFESNYEAIMKDMAYARKLSGRTIDSTLLLEAADAYAKIPQSYPYIKTNEYQTYARPYSELYGIMRAVYSNGQNEFELQNMQNLTTEQADNFYSTRQQKQVNMINGSNMSDAAKTKLLSLEEKVTKPFVFDYTGGYTRFFAVMYTTGMIISFVVAICIAPIFSGEYTSGMDQMILASKHGKGKLIGSKLFTGYSFTAWICIGLTAVIYLTCMMSFGFDGMDAPLQLYLPMCTYPLTMGQTAFIFSICILLGNILLASIVMLLSAKLKTPFGVMIIFSIITIAPMFIHIPDSNIVLKNLINLIPSNVMGFWVVISSNQYELLGFVMQPYIFIPIFAALVSILLIPFSYRIFKKHQIG